MITPMIALVGSPRTLPGTGHGLTLPILKAQLRVSCPPALDLDALAATLASLIDDAPPPTAAAADRNRALAAILARWTIAVQVQADHPIDGEAVVAALTAAAPATHEIVLPYNDGFSARATLRATVRLLGQVVAEGADLAAIRAECGRLVDSLRNRAPRAVNMPHLFEAARRLGVPWRRLAGNVYQIGHGIHARRFDSTMTDATGSIGTSLARNKRVAAELLRNAGLPAPRHELARSADAAAAIAARLGYPVVVKPLDLDGGVGVAAGLVDEPSVRQAFAASAALDREVLVEKHVEGGDFRLLVIGGKVAIAITREPGGVTGDGTSTVAALLAVLNADPRRGTRRGAVLKRVEWDEEAAGLAADQGLSADAVPARGRFVRLRRTANIATGGTPVTVTDRVHPDNLRMAVRAADLFCLDIAGIDYITPDIALPWHAVDGIINEVNAQPSFGIVTAGHLYGEIISWMLKGGDGRIPIATVTGGSARMRRETVALVHAMLQADGRTAGRADAEGAWVGDERMSWTDMSGAPGGGLLLMDRRVDTAVIELPRNRIDPLGLPVDRCDVVALLDHVADPREDDLIARARRAVVMPPDWFGSLPAARSRLAVVSTGGIEGRLDAHCDAGGIAVWREAGGATIGIADGTAPPIRFNAPAPLPAAAAHAVAIAHLLGCHPTSIARTIEALPAIEP